MPSAPRAAKKVKIFQLSIGIQTGPHIGVQKGPLFVMGQVRALSDHAESHDRKEIAPDQNVGPNSCRPSLQLGRNLV
jgi:hypothetical protein